MKKLVLLLICCSVLPLTCFSQECESLYNSAMEYYNKGDFNSAKVYFNRVKDKCGEYRGVSNKIKECEDNLKGENKPGLTVGNSNVSFDPQGGTETVKVNSGEAQWSYGKAPEWLKLSKSKGRLVIECEGNETGEERSADITLYSGEGSNKVYKKIHVTQSESTLSVSTTSLSFPEHGSAIYKIQVESNDSWSVSAQSDSWFNVTKTDEGVSVSCAENSYAKKREGSFSLMTSNNKSVIICIAQDPTRPFLEIDETSIKVKWNVGDRRIKVNTNIPDWKVEVIQGASWCRPIKQSEDALLFEIDNNETGYPREVKFSVSGAGLSRTITVTQGTLGYASLYEDYFINRGSAWRITPISASIYGGGSWGVRVSGYMVRWKVVEADLLNLNASFSKSFLLSWEPMIRGYLPLQRDGLGWTAYVGVGGCVPFVDKPLNGNYYTEHSKLLLESGAEFNLKLKNNQTASGRVFIRIDGTFSVGASFDLHKWRNRVF